ncbi:MAG: TatD family hydrolase [Pseudomonadota bacterium]
MWIDSHCHLNHRHNDDTPSDLIARAKENGVHGIQTICCRISEELDELLDIANNHDNVWCSIGTHPHDAGNELEKAITADEIIALCHKHEKIIGVGESGLDYYYDNSPREDQADSFRKHIHVAKETGLPLIIHTRDAEEDTYKILKEEGACDGKTKVLMHCFSSNDWLAQKSIDEGFYMSFSGMVTFKKSDELREIVKKVPLYKILVETDAPYLAPTPYRGKTNEPAYVKHTGLYMANMFNLTEKEFAQQTTENFFRLFDKIN